MKNKEKKYVFTNEVKTIDNGVVLHRIKAIKSFGDVKEGELGGWIEHENNLSHHLTCWVYDNAMVYGNAKVWYNAKVCENAVVYDKAFICDEALICGNAHVYNSASVYQKASVFADAKVYNNAQVYGRANIYGYAQVYDEARVWDNAKAAGNARIYNNAKVYENALITDNSSIHGWCRVHGKIRVKGTVEIYYKANVYSDECILDGDAIIKTDKDYIVFKNWWSSGRYFIWTRSNNKWCVGCFYGTGDELIKKAYDDSEQKGREYERVVKYVENMLSDSHLIEDAQNSLQQLDKSNISVKEIDNLLDILSQQIISYNEDSTDDSYTGVVDALLNIRLEAIRNNDWKISKMIRESLIELGFIIKDTPDGFEWTLQNGKNKSYNN